MLIFSTDPGTKNFAASFTRIEKNKVEVLATGMFTDTIIDLTKNVTGQYDLFFDRFSKLVLRYGTPDVCCFERFQSRGNKGTLIECVNIMLGLMLHVTRDYNPLIITAATWKNRLNAQLGISGLCLDDIYDNYDMKRASGKKTVHEFDASCIGLYRGYLAMDMAPFEGFVGSYHKYVTKFLEAPRL